MAETDSSSVGVELPDGSRRSVPAGTPAGDVLRAWRPEVGKNLAARLDATPIDLDRPLNRGGSLAPLTFEDRAGRAILHHSAAHVVAKALMEVIPGAKPTVGPADEEGFHYDFDVRPLTPEDLEKIRAAVDRVIAADEPFRRQELSREAALDAFAANPHKQRYIREAPEGEVISVYATGAWIDLCRGPHVPSTRWTEGLHILGFSGVTQGGSPDGLPLQRIRGVAFPTREELAQYLKSRQEAEARDHRALGQRLELFMFVEEAPAFPFWLPKGMIALRELERFIAEQLKEDGYSEIRTPLMFAQSVYERSGHWELYRDNMFLTEVDGRTYGVKPMNCPGAMMVFGGRSRSYRELPLRLAEWAPIHRLEASGTVHGMTRVREMIQDDAHIFLREEDIESEVRRLLDLIRRAFSTFQLTWSYELSTRPDRFLGEAAQWASAERVLKKVLDESGVPYRMSPGEGAFYGPKIDIHIRDSLGRSWQTGTIQVDYQQPTRFGLQYQGPDGALHRPVVVHRTILGSFERFFGVLLEHTAGRLPPWLAPVQIRVLPVAERHQPAAEALTTQLRSVGVRAETVPAQESLSKRVRGSEIDKIPYAAVLGDAEAESSTVTLRIHGEKTPRKLAPSELAELLLDRIRSRSFAP
jgi:threonyl-tRNA synthetase